jgi:hypothetical protein
MSKITLTKTAFTSGEIDPALYGRIDLRAYEEGAATLKNVLVQRTGGVTRRPGTALVAEVPSGAKLFPYDLGAIHDLLVFGEGAVHVVTDGELRQTIAGLPWSANDVAQLDLTLVEEAVLVCHPSFPPLLLARGDGDSWSGSPLTYARLSAADDDERRARPFARFAPPDVSLQAVPVDANDDPTAPKSSMIAVELRSSAPIFGQGYEAGTVFRIKGRQIRLISAAGQGTLAFGLTLEPLVDDLATLDWDEQAFSTVYGWPISAAMHQNRLVFGGCRERPDYIWFSKSGRPFNFDLGIGEDDEAIAFRIVAERRHEIRQLFSGRVLQVFTTAGEWTVSGFPLTPGNARVELQTRVGTVVDRQIAPADVDGATLFIGGTGRDLREFLFTDTEQAYQAADIAILSRHLLREPVDLAFDQARRVIWIARADGRVCAVTIDRNSNIVAWSLQETRGWVRALAMQNGALVMLVERGDAGLAVERLDDALLVDGQRRFTAAVPSAVWIGLDAIADGSYFVVADGAPVGELTVNDGILALPTPATSIELGLGFEHTVEGLPVVSGGTRGGAGDAAYRPIRIGLRLGPTDELMLDTGAGMRSVAFGRKSGMNDVFDVSVRAMGWRRGTEAPPWRLGQRSPGPFNLLSVTVEAKVNG